MTITWIFSVPSNPTVGFSECRLGMLPSFRQSAESGAKASTAQCGEYLFNNICLMPEAVIHEDGSVTLHDVLVKRADMNRCVCAFDNGNALVLRCAQDHQSYFTDEWYSCLRGTHRPATERSKPSVNLRDALRKAMGYVQDGSSTVLKIFQDDATKTFHFRAGRTDLWDESWSGLVVKIIEHSKMEA